MIKESLIKALDKFKVKSAVLCELSGLSSSQLSRFRSGKGGLELDNIEKLIDVLEPKVRSYFLSLLVEQSVDMEECELIEDKYKLTKILNVNRDLMLQTIGYLDRDFQADIMSKIIDIYRSESNVSENLLLIK